MLVLIGTVFAALPSAGAAVGAPLYPDLRTSLPSNLYFERGGDARYRLRFDNTVGNYGGRLEVTVDGNRHIYQNVYDRNVGGSRAVRKKVASDLIYHPEHNHFHFKDFARYELLRKDSAGAYRTTSRNGSKTTFCILDFVRLTSSGATNPQYTTCGATVQGLSAGWGDTYYASLAGQWIDIGTSMLSDGAYAIRSTADPYNRLLETNDGNNVGTTYFTVRNGALSVGGTPPLCTVAPDRGRVGATVQLSCSRFGNGETVDIYWGSTVTTPRKSVTSTSTGAVSTSLAIPESDLGNHYVIAKGRSSGRQAAALFNTLPSVALTQSSGIVGTSTPVTLRGFSAGETIEIRYYKYSGASQSTVVATAVASSRGSSSSTLTVPASPYGSHKVEAVGRSSGAVASTTFAVRPSISLSPTSAPAGSVVGVSLRGFAAGETVRITFAADGRLLTTVTTSHSGSTTPSNASFTVPASTVPATYDVSARGGTSGVSARTALTVTPATRESARSADVTTATSTSTPTATDTSTPAATSTSTPTEVPTDTPEPTATPTSTATEVPTDTPEPEPTSTPVPNGSPTANAGEDRTVADADGSGDEDVALDGSASTDPEGGPLVYVWSMAGVEVATGVTATVTIPVGTHPVTLTVSDDQGATATDEVVVTVEEVAPAVEEGPPVDEEAVEATTD